MNHNQVCPVRLHFGDNLQFMRDTMKTGSVNLIYMDPPFNSNADYNVVVGGEQAQAFSDTWSWGQDDMVAYQGLLVQGGRVAAWAEAMYKMLGPCGVLSYLYFMAERLVECARVLSPTGSIWLHCDDAADYHLRLLMDAIFGPDCYKNTVTWKRTNSGSNTTGKMRRVADSVFYYAREGAIWNEPRQLSELKSDYVEKMFRYQDEGGRYRQDNLTGPATGSGNSSSSMPWRGVSPGKRSWSIPRRLMDKLGIDRSLTAQEKLDLLDEAGYIIWPKKEGGIPSFKHYLTDYDDKPCNSVWDDIDTVSVGGGTSEDVGYATQKPLALLERIINTSSNPGDVVFDPFCGSGTTALAAAKLGRQAISCDITYIAIGVAEDRIRDAGFQFDVTGHPVDFESAEALAEMDKFGYQAWALSKLGANPTGELRSKAGADKGIDGVHVNSRTGIKTIISVKGSRKAVGPRDVQALVGAVHAEKAQRGVFFSRIAPTAPMIAAATDAGFDETGFPMIRIVHQADVFTGHCPNLDDDH